jgi:erythromycin esterase
MVIDDSGQVTPVLPRGRYAFAVATENRFAFVERQLAAPERPLIALSSNCHQVRGLVNAMVVRPALLRMTRVSASTGDQFVATIGADGGFRLCLPEGAYATRVEGAMRSLTVPVIVPAAASIRIDAFTTALIEQVPGDIRVPNADLATFARSLRGQKVLGLGEANHGTAEFFTYRAKLSLELIRMGTLQSILLEADAIRMMAVDDYVMGDNVDIAKAVTALRFWITDVYEFLTFLSEVRTYNASVAVPRRIHVLGIDAQRVEPPVELLLAHRTELAITEQEGELLAKIAPGHAAAFTQLQSNDKAIVMALLARLEKPSSPANLEGIVTRASIAARSIRYQLGYLATTAVGLRDQAMADLADYIINAGGLEQTVIWAHNGHIARQPADTDKSLGQWLSEKFGAAYFPIAFLSYRGAGRAWDKAGQIGVIPHALEPAPPFNVESVILHATGFSDAAWVRLDDAKGALSQWLSLPRFVREFGAAYDPEDTQTLRMFPSAVAAVVVIPHATASSPTPTGVRKITP